MADLHVHAVGDWDSVAKADARVLREGRWWRRRGLGAIAGLLARLQGLELVAARALLLGCPPRQLARVRDAALAGGWMLALGVTEPHHRAVARGLSAVVGGGRVGTLARGVGLLVLEVRVVWDWPVGARVARQRPPFRPLLRRAAVADAWDAARAVRALAVQALRAAPEGAGAENIRAVEQPEEQWQRHH